MGNLEVEVKIKIDKTEEIKKKIIKLGFRMIEKEFFESNIIFDTTDLQLKKKGFLLRLRQNYKTNKLTFKRPSTPKKNMDHYKIREEIESNVSDFENMKKIIMALGFEIFFIYEKYREIYRKKKIIITIDRTPIGNFIEIEGNPAEIDDVSEKLGYTTQQYIVETYYSLFRKRMKSGFMTFE